jgi:hypothetical protein
MELFIYENKCLSDLLCDEIIEIFDSTSEKTNDTLYISFNINENNIWFRIKNIIINELNIQLKNYYSLLNKNNIIDTSVKKINEFCIKKYNKNKGIFNFEMGDHIDYYKKEAAILFFYFFLNDVEDGGGITIFDDYNIKPEKGKILIYPLERFFPFFINTPLSENKYLISGCVYIDI